MRRVGLLITALLLVAGCGSAQQSAPTPAGGSSASSSDPSSTAAASPTPQTFGRYVALGDSYSAAPGNPKTEQDDKCLRSDHDYPHLLAARLGVTKLVDVTCTGAATKDLTGRQYAWVPPQFDALTADTDLVTIGIGGNDLKLVNAIGSCFAIGGGSAGGPCLSSVAADAPKQLPSVGRALVTALGEIHRQAPQAKILLVGYPQMLPTSGTCPAVPLAASDYRYLATLLHGLDEQLESAAQKGGATFVDVEKVTAGHDVCAKVPWINGAQDAPDAIAIHPFPAEQKAVAATLSRLLGR